MFTLTLVLGSLAVDDLPEIVRVVVDAMFLGHPYMAVFLEYICDDLGNSQVLRAIDSFLGNLPFISVRIKEKLHEENPMDVPEVSGLKPELRETALKHIWEERLRERYGCDHVKLKLKRGSTYGEQTISLLDVVTYAISNTHQMINTDGLKVVVEMPPALSLPFHKSIDTKPDGKVVKAVAKSMGSARHHRQRETEKILTEEFGLGHYVVEELLPHDNEMFEYFTIRQHVEKYVEEHAEHLDLKEFVETMQIDPSSQLFRDMHEFFVICPDVMTPAAWFMDKVASRYFHVSGVLPANWENGKVFKTLVKPNFDEDIRLHPIPAIFWYILTFFKNSTVLPFSIQEYTQEPQQRSSFHRVGS